MPKLVSISIILSKIKALEDRFKRFSSQIGYESPQTMKTLKSILGLSTSISIVFLYHNLLQLCQDILKQGLLADVTLFFKGKKKDKSSGIRVILYNNLAFLQLKLGDYPSCLKFLYDSESILISLKGKSAEYSDLQIASSLIGLLCMCKLGKLTEAHDYLESATEFFNSIIREEKKSKFNRDSCSNLYTILTFIGEVLQNPKAFSNFSVFCQEIREKLLGEKNYASSFIFKLFRNEGCSNGLEVLCSQSWTDFCYLIAFFPMILPTTPIVDTDDILREKSKIKKMNESPGYATSKKKRIGDGTWLRENNYSNMMKWALQGLK